MVTSHHEASHRIFEKYPELLAPVFRVLGVPMPAGEPEPLTSDVTEVKPIERRVDTVLRVRSPGGGSGRLIVAIEAQGAKDPDKPVSWAYYLSYLKSKYRCPALLLVVSSNKSTADWAKGPFELGTEAHPALTVHPLVMGPGNTPEIVDPEEIAQDPVMAVFSAITHARSEVIEDILDPLARVLGAEDSEAHAYLIELVECGLADFQAAKEIWEEKIMAVRSYFPGRGTIIERTLQEGEAKGRAEGRAKSVLGVLEMRDVSVPPEVQERVMGCTDLGVLDRWFTRAFSVVGAEELFEGES
ncbi:Rpn family recombination-promoting nuclease/putative transposase [Streptomyces sp. AV19]|uniref:Rpn family recombination-promoting nuclease/putative transposase n=1 Tax=Streptomyces sp. AV19 TaxID=2793068 RepID=UPI0018FEA705|nr:Rpn family recombination-promoting nuclease/putative transposase [Streptomyces sp. AV19]MBH1936147.1 Rpn family recombination-promoting nuclease/putative transposase [Streptomyces sp. AV19]MDG4534057.1 hypothetical protein [Streptomyces sp. AV19]